MSRMVYLMSPTSASLNVIPEQEPLQACWTGQPFGVLLKNLAAWTLLKAHQEQPPCKLRCKESSTHLRGLPGAPAAVQ